MTSITALSSILHDGETYSKGDTLDVSKEQADALIEAGVASKGRQAQEAEVVETPEGNGDGLDGLGFQVLKNMATEEGIDTTDLKSKDAVREAIRAKRATVAE